MGGLKLALEMTPAEAKRRIEAGEAIELIDVREPFEYAICSLDGAELIPMNTIPERLGELDERADDKLLLLYCHHGIRSLNAVSWLRGQGVENCQSLAGGIERWSVEVDPGVPRY
jgi:adenylyltransferase/sulfurtransferase